MFKMRNLKWREDKKNAGKKEEPMLFLSPDTPFIPHGLGRLLYAGIFGAYVLEGYFKNGYATGFCRWIWADGVKYEGSLRRFQCHGEGHMIMGPAYRDHVIEGVFKNGRLVDGKVIKEN
mmetsp:Transcript_13654/g.21378  ORF Transcript_13654/g.21378 Transcript_13654/m.21378 type:complete len:119 (+) Transcript_13654:854-1210(+)